MIYPPEDIEVIPENREKLIAWYMADGDTREEAKAVVAVLLGEAKPPGGLPAM